MRRSFILVGILLLSTYAKAWVYPEHRQIAVLAIEQLSPQHRQLLDDIWAQIRVGHEARLSESIIDPSHGRESEVLDYASWSAIAGDHSCSPQQMMDIILKTDWILKVDHIATRLQNDLAKAKRESQTINAIRNSDLRLQSADLEYATRAGSNHVHFLLSRDSINWTYEYYIARSLEEGAPLNALGAYSYFHTKALEMAALSREAGLSQEDRSAILLAALANEAFALHFIQDVYAAGHVAGTWEMPLSEKEHMIIIMKWVLKRKLGIINLMCLPEMPI